MARFHQEQTDGPAAASPVELLGIDGALEKCPILDPNWLKAAFFDPDCWDVEVESLLQGYLRSAKAKGAVVRQSCQVTAARREGRALADRDDAGARCVRDASSMRQAPGPILWRSCSGPAPWV